MIILVFQLPWSQVVADFGFQLPDLLIVIRQPFFRIQEIFSQLCLIRESVTSKLSNSVRGGV